MSPSQKRRKRGPSKYQAGFDKKQREIAEERQRRVAAREDLDQIKRSPKPQTKGVPPVQTTVAYNGHRGMRMSRNFTLYALVCVGIAVVAVFIIIPPQPTSTTNGGNDDGTGGTTYALTQSVTTIDGETIPLASYAGKHLILYFTGASCIPCKAQLPFIVNAYNTYKSTGKVEVVSLDIQGQTIDALIQWRSENGITWKVCQDTGLVLGSHFSIVSMPTLVICDENGHETARYVGAQEEATINQIFQSCVS